MVAALTIAHVVISLVGIGAGFVVLFGMLTAKRMDRWTAIFLVTTAATSVTGFFFPVDHFMPSHALGIASLIVLAVAIPARYSFALAGSWRWLYVVGSVSALWLNMFVLIAQIFQKTPALKALAPTQSEPPFLATEVLVMTIFIGLGVAALRRFHVQPAVELPPSTLPAGHVGATS